MPVRLAAAADVPVLGQVLARAFDQDPIFRAILPDDARRGRALPVLFREWLTRLHIPLQTAWTTDDLAGAALWSPPGQWHVGLLEQALMAPRMVGVLGTRALSALRVLLAIESPHPKAPPHYYLRVIGCDPDHQGRGVGAMLVRPALDRCDAEGLPAYLESSNERNHSFYMRHGFRETGQVVTHLGPRAWLMWREPARR